MKSDLALKASLIFFSNKKGLGISNIFYFSTSSQRRYDGFHYINKQSTKT
jgi:hypothetical protein